MVYAKISVNIQTCTTWDDLKHNFSDHKDEVCLIRDLNLLKEGIHYFKKCIKLLSLLFFVNVDKQLNTSKKAL